MVYIEPPQNLDGLLSFITKPLKKVVGWVAGKGNTPGTPETRKYGYSPTEVAAQVTQNLINAPADPVIDPNQGKLILGGAAALALILLMSGGKKNARKF